MFAVSLAASGQAGLHRSGRQQWQQQHSAEAEQQQMGNNRLHPVTTGGSATTGMGSRHWHL